MCPLWAHLIFKRKRFTVENLSSPVKQQLKIRAMDLLRKQNYNKNFVQKLINFILTEVLYNEKAKRKRNCVYSIRKTYKA